MCIYVYMYVCMYVCMYICMYIYIYIYTHTHSVAQYVSKKKRHSFTPAVPTQQSKCFAPTKRLS